MKLQQRIERDATKAFLRAKYPGYDFNPYPWEGRYVCEGLAVRNGQAFSVGDEYRPFVFTVSSPTSFEALVPLVIAQLR